MNKYDLVRSHIDYVRQTLREVSDDSNFTDEQIYMALIMVRAMIMERRLAKGKQLPESAYQVICLKLCMASYAECQECFTMPVDCEVLKTTVDIPEIMYDGVVEIGRVSTIGGQEIAPLTEDLHKLRKYRKTGKNNFYYVKLKNKLAVFNVPSNRLRAIKIRALFLDPAAAELISTCDTKCADVMNATFGTRAADRLDIHDEVIKRLINVDRMPEDRSNNADCSQPKQQI